MDIVEAARRVQAAAEAGVGGDPVAHVKLLDAIHQLRLLAETPAEKTMRLRFQPIQNNCIRVAVEYGIFEAIVAKNGNSITAEELSRHTGADELLITRIMRVVTNVGLCKEVDYATYASNDTTRFIIQKGAIGAEKHHTDLGFPVGGKLVEMIRKQALHQFPSGPDQKNPFEYTFGLPLFEYFEKDQEQKEAFDAYMSMRRPADAPQWFDIYPAAEQLSTELRRDSEAALIVDVGGGKGHEVSKFRQRFPQLPGRLIVQDLQSTFDGASGPRDFEQMVHDFFTVQPVKHSRIYYLRNIMHDWPDDKCRLILSNIVAAMDPDYSRVLIDDYVLPNTGAEERAAAMDVLMLMFVSGIERTRRHWEELLRASGLEIERIWSPTASNESVIEARVRR